MYHSVSCSRVLKTVARSYLGLLQRYASELLNQAVLAIR